MNLSPAEVGDMNLWTYGAARSEWNQRQSGQAKEAPPPTPDQMTALRARMREMMPDVKG